MATKNYTTKTAALKATIADVNKLETKKIKVNGKDVATSVKHPNDTREVITENDLWGSWAEITNDGEIIFHDDEIIYNQGSDYGDAWNMSITKIVDNKAYIDDTLYANIQTEKLKEGYYMFGYSSALDEFSSDLSSLENGEYMFSGCTNLTTFASDSNGSPMNLSSLTNGSGMFSACYELTTFSSDLSSLTIGSWMFSNCSKFTTFNSDLSSLTIGGRMFYDCSNLKTFTSDLSSLTIGSGMFEWCYQFTAFTSDLSSLTNGYHMFYKCKLDTDSLIHIAETIKDVRVLTNGSNSSAEIYKTIHIGIGSTTPTEEETELLTEIHNKGWQVYVGCNNGDASEFIPTALTPIDGEETITPIPYWAKPQEVDEEHAEYVGEDGKFYIILGGNYIFVDDPETYGLFTSLENAAANMRLTKIERN